MASPRRFLDAWGASSAIAIAAMTAFALIIIASPWIGVNDSGLARRIDWGDAALRTEYASVFCPAGGDEATPCPPELVGTVELVQALQVVAIASIALIGAFSRKRRTSLEMLGLDALVLWGSLIGGFVLLEVVWRGLPAAAAIALSLAIIGVTSVPIWMRWRGRAQQPGEIAIITLYGALGGVIALVVTPAIIVMKLALAGRVEALPPLGIPIAVIGGLCLAIPVALSLLAFLPTSRQEGRDWDHLRRADDPGAPAT